MAHYAELDGSNVVQSIIVVDNAIEAGAATVAEEEILGLAWLATFAPTIGLIFKKCSYNANFRGKYPALGDVYDAGLNIFKAS